MDHYFARCAEAATRQGLDPMIERLELEDIEHFVEQTGGFVMVITVRRDTGCYGIARDGARSWLLAWYEGDAFDTSEQEAQFWTGLSEDEVIQRVA